MKTKPTMQIISALGIAILFSIMSVNVMAERKGMMSDKEMEKMMRDRDSDDMPMMGGRGMMMGGMGSGMMGGMGSGMMGGMGSGMMGGMGSCMMGGMGSGMMGGMGSGMMGGMGSGMMGGMGSGMMGGMGSGMMGGMGSGMMGGMGHGMMMGRMASMLDISDKQRASMRKIAGDLRRSNWPLLSQIMDARDQLAELNDKEPRDAKVIGKVYGQIFELKRQMIEAGIDAQNKWRGLLSKEQKERLEKMSGMMPGR